MNIILVMTRFYLLGKQIFGYLINDKQSLIHAELLSKQANSKQTTNKHISYLVIHPDHYTA